MPPEETMETTDAAGSEAQSQQTSPSPEAEEGAFAEMDAGEGEAGSELTQEDGEEGEPEAGQEKKAVDYARFSKVYGRMKHLERELDRLTRQQGTTPAGQEEEEEQGYVAEPRRKQADPGQAAMLPPKPTEDAFDSYEEYIEALTDWKVTERSYRDREQERTAESRRNFDKNLSETRASRADFDSKAYLPQALVEVVVETSEMPGELAYYWGEHPDEAVALIGLTKTQQAARIAKLEERLRREQPERRTQPRTKFPNAKTLTGTREGASKPVSDMSMEEYAAYMNKRDGIPYRPDW